jgi:hypothetical protein
MWEDWEEWQEEKHKKGKRQQKRKRQQAEKGNPKNEGIQISISALRPTGVGERLEGSSKEKGRDCEPIKN